VVMAGAMRHEADGVLMEQLDLPPPAVGPLFVGRAIAGMAS
jgi:hypothetical protein